MERENSKDNNKIVYGIVKHVKSDSKSPIVVQIYYNYNIFIEGWDVNIDDPEIINQLDSYQLQGQPVKIKLV